MYAKLEINKFAMEMSTFHWRTCKIKEDDEHFVVLTMLYGLDMKYVYVKRTLFKLLGSGDALSEFLQYG